MEEDYARIYLRLRPTDLLKMGRLNRRLGKISRYPRFWKIVDLQFMQFFDPGELGELLLMPIGELNLSAAQIPETIFTPGSRGSGPDFYVSIQKLIVTRTYHQHSNASTLLQICKPQELIFDYNTITIPMIEAMGRNKRLKVLSMQHCTFSPFHFGPAFKRIADLPSDFEFPKTLEKLTMNHTYVHEWYWTNHTRVKEFYFRMFEKNIILKYLALPVAILQYNLYIVGKLQFLEVLAFCECEWTTLKPAFHRIVRDLPQLKAVHIQKHEEIVGNEDRDNINNSRKFSCSKSEIEKLKAYSSVQHKIEMTIEYTKTECKICLVRN